MMHAFPTRFIQCFHFVDISYEIRSTTNISVRCNPLRLTGKVEFNEKKVKHVHFALLKFA